MRLIAAAPELDFTFSDFHILRDGALEPVSKFARAPKGYWDAVPRRILPEGWVFEGSLAGQSMLFHPIFQSAMMFTKDLFEAVGGYSPSMRGRRSEDGEFTLRCLYRARVGALPEPLVAIRKHASNDSGNALLCLVDEVWTLGEIKAHHPEAAAYAPIIEAEILRRAIAAAHLAFRPRPRPAAPLAGHDPARQTPVAAARKGGGRQPARSARVARQWPASASRRAAPASEGEACPGGRGGYAAGIRAYGIGAHQGVRAINGRRGRPASRSPHKTGRQRRPVCVRLGRADQTGPAASRRAKPLTPVSAAPWPGPQGQ